MEFPGTCKLRLSFRGFVSIQKITQIHLHIAVIYGAILFVPFATNNAPPSTAIVCPVIYEDAALEKNIIAAE